MSYHRPSRLDPMSDRLKDSIEIASIKSQYQPAYKPWNKKPVNKCLQNNLVYAMYLPAMFEDDEVTKSDQYFGKYGTITSVISSFDSSQKNDSYTYDHLQSYITYSNQKQAAIAISAVNDIIHGSKIIRTTYGTNRICSSFYKGETCTVRNCFYLHDQKNFINIQGSLRTDFEKQKLIAYDIVKKNLAYFLVKIQEKRKQAHKDSSRNSSLSNGSKIHFPSIKQTIDSLIERKIISKSLYQHAYQQCLTSKKKMSQTVKNIVYIRYKTKPYVQTQLVKEKLQEIVSKTVKVQKVEPQQKPISKKQNRILPKSEFLMNQIIASLDDDNHQNVEKLQNQAPKLQRKEFQPIKTSLRDLPIYWQFYDEKQHCEDDQLQTEESQTASCNQQMAHWTEIQHGGVSQVQNISQNEKFENSSHQKINYVSKIVQKQCPVMNRLQERLSKNPLIKMSKFQFTYRSSVFQNQTEYQNVTSILRRNLIK